tara:strand:- start:1396 stop:2472 length:1077 start_codon:yes stop_codon:yes gene_type:complete
MKKIYKNIIIGSGFSACMVNIFLKKDFLIISSNDKFLSDFPNRNNLTRYLKFFTKKFNSKGRYKFKLKNSELHDTLIHGGNTNLWGGICNIQEIKNYMKNLKNVIKFKKITLEDTGNFSNVPNLYQMQNYHGSNNNIFNSKDYFKNIIFGHLIKFDLINKNLICLYIKEKSIKKIYCKNLILAINFVQLVEVLINSKVLKDKDFISLEEYRFKTTISFKKSLNSYKKKMVVLAYSLPGIIKHYLGLQKNFNKFLFRLLSFFPFYYNQIFYADKKFAFYKVNKKQKLIEEIHSKTDFNFGKSIHYFNMKINNTKLNKFLKIKSKNIFGVSSPFIEKANPGPISNSIINTSVKISKKLNR